MGVLISLGPELGSRGPWLTVHVQEGGSGKGLGPGRRSTV